MTLLRESRQRVQRALTALLGDAPFFGALALRMPVEPAKDTVNVSGDGATVRYNPEWAADAPMDDIKGAIAHVVLACGLKHHLRRGDRDDARWQRASHEVTLPILREAGLAYGAGGMEDATVEQAYDRLPAGGPGGGGAPPLGAVLDFPGGGDPSENAPEGAQGAPGASGGGKGEGQGENAPEGAPGAPEGEPGEAEAEAEADGGGAGSEAEGQAAPEPEPEAGRAGNEEMWENAMAQARAVMESQKGIVCDPGRLAAMVDAATARRVDWRTVLRAFLIDRAQDDYTWGRPNRRLLDQGLYLPDRYSERAAPLVLIVDTSGSMGDAETRLLGAVWSEVRAVAEECQPESIRVIQCDARVTSDEVYDDMGALPERVEIRGGGGTDFEPAYALLAETRDVGGRPPACVVHFTDLCCYSFGEPPECPVVFAKFGDSRYGQQPPFGDVVPVPYD